MNTLTMLYAASPEKGSFHLGGGGGGDGELGRVGNSAPVSGFSGSAPATDKNSAFVDHLSVLLK